MQDSAEARRLVDALFEQAIDLPADERRAFLDRASGGLVEVRDLVEELIRLAEPGGEAAPLSPLVTEPMWRELAAELAPDDPAGRRVDRWRIVGEIGRGGMGTVYLAERAEGEFEQRAALKLLRPGLDSDEVLRRFERERQILAGLEHPGIARLLDGGRTESGQPYFVMELVEGQAIDRYCDGRRLSVRERLRLVVQVGRVVEHAHHKLIVHRDLKPSNIIVTAEGQVKLLDFGIAKPLASEAAPAREVLTRTVTRLMTPEYASPEQVLGHPVSVASDVYQLGALLYRLLTGRMPYRLSSDSAAEIERVVCHQEPSRPSAVVERRENGQDTDPGAIAAARRTTPRALARSLGGDLDTIVTKALRKEPERRYASVAGLVADLERHLEGRPVEARGDTLAYRLGRFVSRHRFGVLAVGLLLFLLVAYAVTVTMQARALSRERDRAQAEATKAQQVKALVLRLFEGADPQEARGEELSARELLDRGWASIEGELTGQPEVQVELLDTVGEIYRELGLYEQAEPFLTQAVERGRTLASSDAPLLAAALRSNGRLRRDLGGHDAADTLLNEALTLYRDRFGETHAEVATTLRDLGWNAHQRGDYAAAAARFREALAMRRARVGDEHRDVAESLADVGVAMRAQGDYAGAEPFLSQAVELQRRLLPAGHPQLADNLSSLAGVHRSLGDLETAEPLYREALELMTRTRGDDHAYVAIIMNNLARVRWARGDPQEAESLYRRALVIRRQALGDRHPAVAMNLNDLGRLLHDEGELEQAERLYGEALDIYPSGHPWRAATAFNLGELFEGRGEYRAAERLYRQSLAAGRARYGDDHEAVGADLHQLGVVLRQQGNVAEAESFLRDAITIFRKGLPDSRSRLGGSLGVLGTLLLEAGRPADAEPVLREALDLRRADADGADERTAEVARALERARASLRP